MVYNTKYHTCLKDRNSFFQFGKPEYKIMMPTRLVAGEGSLWLANGYLAMFSRDPLYIHAHSWCYFPFFLNRLIVIYVYMQMCTGVDV